MHGIFKHRFVSAVSRAALAALLAASGGLAAANPIHVAIDTSTFGAASGYIDMQLSASGGVPLATAVVSNLVGFDSSAFIDSWGVTPVAGGYAFHNDTANDLFHAVDFSGTLSFDLDFDGAPDPATSYVSHFVVSAFDGSYDPLGHYDPFTGALADFSWTPALSAQADGSVGVSVSDPSVSVVPEPADGLLLGLGLVGMMLALRRKVADEAAALVA
jgi:hypothetical protein